jgi:hypothetical protein
MGHVSSSRIAELQAKFFFWREEMQNGRRDGPQRSPAVLARESRA